MFRRWFEKTRLKRTLRQEDEVKLQWYDLGDGWVGDYCLVKQTEMLVISFRVLTSLKILRIICQYLKPSWYRLELYPER